MNFLNPVKILPTIVCVLLLLAINSGTAQPKLKTQEARSEGQSPQVRLNVIAVDQEGRTIADARAEDFRLKEEGAEQNLLHFSRDDRSLVYGLAIDNSGSLRQLMPHVIAAASRVINSGAVDDEAFVMRFVDSETIQTLQDFTTDKEALNGALEQLRVAPGQTALVDAIYVSVQKLNQRPDGERTRRRALIIITDGEDRVSRQTQAQLWRLLRASDVQVFAIGLTVQLDRLGGFTRPSPRDRATNFLTRLTQESGGRVFFPNSPAELSAVIEELARSLRTQYILGYVPTRQPRGGSYRRVQITLTDGANRQRRTAITRAGYTVPGN